MQNILHLLHSKGRLDEILNNKEVIKENRELGYIVTKPKRNDSN